MMEELDISIDDFPMPGSIKSIEPYPENAILAESNIIDMPMYEQILRYSSPLPAEYHEIILQEAAAHGLTDSFYHEGWAPSPDLHVVSRKDLSGLKPRSNDCRFQLASATQEDPSEEQISCTDFLRESYPPSLVDASPSSSSDESTSSSATSLEIPSSRGQFRSSSSTLTPQRQRWRTSTHRRSHDGRDLQSKSIDSSKLYKKLRQNLRGASLLSHSSRSSSTTTSSQEALHTLQRFSEKNPTMLNLNEVHISEPMYSRSTLEFCEDKISTWPCGSALKKSLIDEISLNTEGPEEVISCRHFECHTPWNDENMGDLAQRETSRFSWSTIYTICEQEEEETLSWRKKLFKRPKGRPKIPEWLTSHDT